MSANAADVGYNGWTNWSTWNVNLWLSNDESLYFETLDRIEDAKKDAGPRWSAHLLGKVLKNFVHEIYRETGQFGDLQHHGTRKGNGGRGLGDVNWDEIGTMWMEAE